MKKLIGYSSAVMFAAAMSFAGGAFAQSSTSGIPSSDTGTLKSGRTSTGMQTSPNSSGMPDNATMPAMKSGASATGNSSGAGISSYSNRDNGNVPTGSANPGNNPNAGSSVNSNESR